MRVALVWCTVSALPALLGACKRPAERTAVRESASAAPAGPAGTAPVAPPTSTPAAVVPVEAPRRAHTDSVPRHRSADSVASLPARAASPVAKTSVIPPAPPPTAAVATGPQAAPSTTPARAFGPGERLTYAVKYGFIHAGDASLEILGRDTVRGTEALHARFTVTGGTRFFRVHDEYETWFDPRSMSSLRYIQHVDEGRYRANRDFEIYPSRRSYAENGGAAQPSVPEPLDEASFLYFLRTITLEPGRTYDFDRYFRPDRNPVRVVVLRRERITVPAGTFNTVVLRPIIKTKGLFSEGGQAEVWLSDDSSRTMVQMRSHLTIGSLSLYLKSLRH